MKAAATFFMAAGILIALSGLGAADDGPGGRLRVECPASWPGPDRQGTNLSYAGVWINGTSLQGPDIPDELEPGEVELDCAYGRGGELSPLHITVVVPGADVRCHEPKGRDLGFWCNASATAGATARRYVAEPVTPATRLLGFGLGQRAADIAARGDGFACEGGPEGPIVCRRGADEITVRFADGRASAMEWRRGSDEAFSDVYHALLLRFGLFRDQHIPPAHMETWQTPGQPVALDVEWYGPAPYAVLHRIGPERCRPTAWDCPVREKMFSEGGFR